MPKLRRGLTKTRFFFSDTRAPRAARRRRGQPRRGRASQENPFACNIDKPPSLPHGLRNKSDKFFIFARRPPNFQGAVEGSRLLFREFFGYPEAPKKDASVGSCSLRPRSF